MPVVEAIGGRGRGIVETFQMAQQVAVAGKRAHAFVYAPEVEGVVKALADKIAARATGQPTTRRPISLPPVLSADAMIGASSSCGAGHCHSNCCAPPTGQNSKVESRKPKIETRSSKLETRNSKLEAGNPTLESRRSELDARNSEVGIHNPLTESAEYRKSSPRLSASARLHTESISKGGLLRKSAGDAYVSPAASVAVAEPAALPLAETATLSVAGPAPSIAEDAANLAAAPTDLTVARPTTSTALFPPPRFRALQWLQSKPGEQSRPRSGVRSPESKEQWQVASDEGRAAASQTADLNVHSSDSGIWKSAFEYSPSDSGRRTPDPELHPSGSGLRTSDFGQSFVQPALAEIASRTGQPADAAVSAARHAACLTLFECVVRVSRPRADWRERVDHVAMHPIWGYAVLTAVFLGFFRLIFDVGKLGEDRILTVFDALVAVLTQHMNPQGPLFAASKGAVLGTAGAVAIVLPYLLPFLVGLAILEDIGYLSRVGYLMDAAMHRLGLHGTATLPILVGYGCSVPAVMATRILTTRRDRFIAAFLAVLVPCSARMTVIFALVGFYLGANYALGIYALNIIVVALCRGTCWRASGPRFRPVC